MKKLKVDAMISEGNVAFSVHKSKDMTLVEILGVLDLVEQEIREKLEEQIKISKV